MTTTITVESHNYPALIRVIDRYDDTSRDAHVVATTERVIAASDGKQVFHSTTTRTIEIVDVEYDDPRVGQPPTNTSIEVPLVVPVASGDEADDNAIHEPLPVAGYQPQSLGAIEAVNANKHAEEVILRSLDELKANPDIDQRWLAIGRTHIEEGFMAINRAIFKPARVTLPEDIA